MSMKIATISADTLLLYSGMYNINRLLYSGMYNINRLLYSGMYNINRLLYSWNDQYYFMFNF
jgi:hypothetical protein